MRILTWIENQIRKHYLEKVPVGGISRKDPYKRYNDESYSVQMRTGKVYDHEIAKLVRDHTHWWDRLDAHFISDCTLEATDIVYGYVEPPKGKWYFGRGYYGRWIEEDEWKKRHNYPHEDWVKDHKDVRHIEDDERSSW